MNYVPGYGNPGAKLCIVGEAPGKAEDDAKLPFVGPSGYLLDECLEFAGIERSQVYITNVCKIRPPNNKLKDLHLIGRTLDEFIPILINELNELKPNCILAVGNTALEVLTGNKGIEKYRGSILYSKYGFKVVASLHPASLLHEAGEGMSSWRDLALIKQDVKRAVEQSAFPEIRSPARTLEIARNSLDLHRFLNLYNNSPQAASDIETSKTIPTCISLAFNSWHAISIPLLDEKIPSHDLSYIWKLISEFLGDNKVKLIAQNGKFDTKRCRFVGLKWSNLWFDTMLAWHTLFAELPKGLGVQASILTEEPYYKDEGSEYVPGKHNFDRMLLYNAKDSVITYECFERELELLNQEPELKDFFFNQVMPLHELYSNMEDVGIKIDEEIRKKLHKKYSRKRDEKNEQLIECIINGDESMRSTFEKFNSNSPKQVANLLFGYLKLPIRKDTGEDTLKSLVNNSIKDERRKSIVTGILEQRKIRKIIGTYIECITSSDGRIRTEMMVVGTESGRTSTQVRKQPIVVKPEGLALQTMMKHEDVTLDVGGNDLRSMFIADEGYSFFEPDLSQAEDRVVCVLAKDWQALKDYERTIFKRNKNGLKDDRHTITAASISNKDWEDVTDYDRQTGKKTRHSGNYDMGKHQGMLNCAKFGIFISEWKMGEFLKAFHQSNPNIRNVFHAEIQEKLAENNCILYSPHGRKRQFFNKWGSELFKEAYSFIPQATVSDQLKFALLRIVARVSPYVSYICLESHDSFLALVKDEYVNEIAKITKEELEKPINFKRCSLSRDYDLVIPCDLKVGKRWIEESTEFPDGMKGYKIQ